jgi:heptaprenyl diphosphate synthase
MAQRVVMTASTFKVSEEDWRIARLAALAIVIHIAESALPTPLPGIKPGFANIITLLVLFDYGWRTAAWVSLLRVLLSSLVIGTFLSPTFLLSLAGALASLIALGAGRWLPGTGPVGLGVLTALAHMAGQFVIAWWLFLPHPGLWSLLPVFMSAALVFGLFSGIITHAVMQRLAQPTP